MSAKEDFSGLTSDNSQARNYTLRCAGCQMPLLEKTIMKLHDLLWHAGCLICFECGQHLRDKCYTKFGRYYCAQDFFRKYGTRCAGCGEGIQPSATVRRARDFVYHVHCFFCLFCQKQLDTGDRFYLMDDQRLLCQTHYYIAVADRGGNHKRPRTTISSFQLETLKTAYNNSPKPSRNIREKLSKETGLDMRVVQVWFQNRRAKEKRLKREMKKNHWNERKSFATHVTAETETTLLFHGAEARISDAIDKHSSECCYTTSDLAFTLFNYTGS